MDIPYTVKPRPDTGLYNAKVGIWLFLASEVMLFGALFSSYILLRVGAEKLEWPHGVLNVYIGTFNTFVLISSSITVVMAWASLKMNNFRNFKIFQGLTIMCAFLFLGVKSYEYSEKFKHYTLVLKDGRNMTGHVEVNGKTAFFLNDVKLNAKGHEIPEFTFHPDPVNAISNIPLEKTEPTAGKGEAAKGEAKTEPAHETHAEAGAAHHEAMVIKSSDVKRLSAFVPAHSTYFGIYFCITGLHGLHVLGGAIVMFYFWMPGSKMWRTEPERFINRIEVSGLFWHFVDLVWIFLFPVLYLL
ncbi:MAG: cyoC [Verrucomicrobiales bacterium]|nr:cyoC [Verrucomicrobiales bacterium]